MSFCPPGLLCSLGIPEGTYLIYLGLPTREGKCESHRQFLVLDVFFLHEVSQALGDMVKKLEKAEGRQEGEKQLRGTVDGTAPRPRVKSRSEWERQRPVP